MCIRLNKKLLVILLTIILLVTLLCPVNAVQQEKSDNKNSRIILTDNEIRVIDDFVNNISVEDGVGQLFMVGVPSDILNFENNKATKKLICDFGIGNVFMNTYNYYNPKYNDSSNRNEFFQKVIEYHNFLQSLTSESEHKLPLLIGVDFESPKYSSIKQYLVLPPAALTLGTLRDPVLIRFTGQLVGHELCSLGINVLMGPVLDLDFTQQGHYSDIISNRSFGSDPLRVYSLTSHYIAGLHDENLMVFGKHFPSHSHIDNNQNPHSDSILIETSSRQEFFDNSLPYPHFNLILDGVMTSHLRIAFMKNSDRPVTFYSNFINRLLRESDKISFEGKETQGFGYSDHVIITDDLSNMGAIDKYMKEYNKSYGEIAIEAFDAGHDILLFSHIETPGVPQRGQLGDFNLDDLNNVKTQLVEHIESSDVYEDRFRQSLRRVVLLKAKINKSYGRNIDKLIGNQAHVWSVPETHNLDSILEPDFVKNNGFTTSDKLIEKVINESMLKISEAANYNFQDLESDTKIAFYVNDKYLYEYKNAFENRFLSAKFEPVYLLKTTEFEQFSKKVLQDLNENDYLVYTVFYRDDATILNKILEQEKRNVNSKLIIMLHNTPKMLHSNLLHNATIIGAFTNHKLSYKADIEVLRAFL